jgi:hypothetical protein
MAHPESVCLNINCGHNEKSNFHQKRGFKLCPQVYFHISDYKYGNVEHKNGVISYQVLPNHRLLVCPNCKSTNVVKKGGFTRRLKTIPIGTKPVFINFFKHRPPFHQELRAN